MGQKSKSGRPTESKAKAFKAREDHTKIKTQVILAAYFECRRKLIDLEGLSLKRKLPN